MSICPECSVRKNDILPKKLLKCSQCEREFCEFHLEPKLAFFSAIFHTSMIEDQNYRLILEEDIRRDDAHHCIPYTKKRIEEIRSENQEIAEILSRALDKSKIYNKNTISQSIMTKGLNGQKCVDCGGSLIFKEKTNEVICSNCGLVQEKISKLYERPRTRKTFSTKKIIGLFLLFIIMGALLWYAPTIISYIQNLFSNSSNASYIRLMLRDGMNHTAAIEFNDTEYSFDYTGGFLSVRTFIDFQMYSPHEGDTYTDFGIETKISSIDSDYVSDYIVILVRPTVQNYAASQHYTKVTIAAYQMENVNISSGLNNKTNQYWFSYVPSPVPIYVSFTIGSTSQRKNYNIFAGAIIRDFEIETRIYKVESEYVVIYVKPLY